MAEWTDEAIERLKALIQAGHSASETAKRLGCGFSRNAVLGKAYRLGLAFCDRPGAPSSESVNQRVEQRQEAARRPPKPWAPHRPPRAAPPPRFTPTPSSANPRTLRALKTEMCRWPLDMSVRREATADSLFCAAPVREEGCAYCAVHAGRAFAPTGTAKDLAHGLRRYA